MKMMKMNNFISPPLSFLLVTLKVVLPVSEMHAAKHNDITLQEKRKTIHLALCDEA